MQTDADGLHVKACAQDGCPGRFVYLASAVKVGKFVPTDLATVSEDDLARLARGDSVTYNSGRGHVSHFLTCTNPGRFGRRR